MEESPPARRSVESYEEKQARVPLERSEKKRQNKRDLEMERVNKYVRNRDKSCRLWAILVESEKQHVLTHFSDEYYFKKELDPAHFYGKRTRPEFKYDADKIVLMRRFFHTRLDKHLHPIYGTQISREARLAWFAWARNGIREVLI